MDAYEIEFKQRVVDLVRATRQLCNALDAISRCEGDPLLERTALHLALGARYDVKKALDAVEGK